MSRSNLGRREALALAVSIGIGLSGGCSDGNDSSAPSQPAPAARTEQKAPAAAPSQPPPKQETRSQAELIAAGRSVYNANCIACHALDPSQDGALGPAVAGASAELLEARIVHGNYPEGYTPKRPSRVMVALPHLAPQIGELAAYLGSLESS